ncbi:MAG: relaxase domain-containing protein [Candidatus Binataceae bacterium]|nr:relaxase domain-containing protein [Candidatus Binataceae bacterium]
MLVMSKGALSAKQAETYYQEKYSQDDYYTEECRVVGQWFGRGAEALGLAHQISPDDFRAVLHGQNPASGQVLVPNAKRSDERRAGWDATFNAPKSVSIQALVGTDARLADAHRAAVERALGELEGYALSRQHGGHEWVITGNLVAARFDHIAARPSQGSDDGYGPDPHLHTHVVIANMTMRPDGAWRGLDPVEIYRSQSFATAVYRSELSREVQQLGYRIDVTGADGRWELEGFTRERVMAFSRRRQDIEAAMARQGLSGAAAAQNLAHQTRGSKDRRDEESLKAEWRERAREYGIQLAHPSGYVQSVSAQRSVADALEYSVAHNTEREAVIDRRALEATALQHAMGKADLEQVRRVADAWERDNKLIRIGTAVSSPQGAYITSEMVALERANLDSMRHGQGRAESIASAEQVRAWAEKRGLLSDQITVAEVTLTANDWVTAIEGRAGTAKTTTVGAIREFAEQRGYAVRGFAPTTRAVKALADAGVPARTVASLIENPLPEAQSKELWIIDESSLLGARQVNALLHRARDAGVARIVFVGDQRQHHAIEAGRPLHQMQQAGMRVAQLDTIRRQRDPELRKAVNHAANGEIAETIGILERFGRIRELRDSAKRYASIAVEYAVATAAGERVLVVSPANEERRQLNAVIRQALKERSLVGSGEVTQTVLVNRDLTRSQRAHARNYEVGDTVRFTRGSKRRLIEKGSHAEIERVDFDADRLAVVLDDGRHFEYSPKRLAGVEVFRAEQRKFAAGDRIQFRAPERTLKLANGEFATIVAIDERTARIRTEDGRVVEAHRLRHIDYGYASTSHSSQGATVDRVIVNIDTMRSAELVNRKQFYVSISRARHGISVYADDRERLRQVVNRSREKSTALEQIPVNVSHSFKIIPERTLLAQNRSYGIRR